VSVVAPRISRIFQAEHNTSDSITCTAEGIPEPTVTWKRISGSMPESASGMSGRRQAVLKNLQDGTHTWMCTATNDLGSDNVTVTFTGAFCSVQMLLRYVLLPAVTCEMADKFCLQLLMNYFCEMSVLYLY